jgi:hypothetical protein
MAMQELDENMDAEQFQGPLLLPAPPAQVAQGPDEGDMAMRELDENMDAEELLGPLAREADNERNLQIAQGRGIAGSLAQMYQASPSAGGAASSSRMVPTPPGLAASPASASASPMPWPTPPPGGARAVGSYLTRLTDEEIDQLVERIAATTNRRMPRLTNEEINDLVERIAAEANTQLTDEEINELVEGIAARMN